MFTTSESRFPRPFGHVFVISGPSGVGKDYIADKLKALPEYGKLGFSTPKSYTTRARRSSDPEDSIYEFVSEEQFDELIETDMVEHSESHGHRYGTSRSGLAEMLGQGKNVLKILDKAGAASMKELLPGHTTTIYLKPPDLSVLEERLSGRGSEDAAEYKRRMIDSIHELIDIGDYDYVVTAGEDSAATVGIVLAIILGNLPAQARALGYRD